MIIAIDGYAGTGKSTISVLLAKELNFININSGLIYRYFGYLLLKNNITNNNYSLKKNETKTIIEKSNIDFEKFELIKTKLYKQEVSAIGTLIAKEEYARIKATEFIQNICKNKNVIVDGRDIGTNVFPNAEFKFFFIIDETIRAERLLKENSNKNIEKLKIELSKRDIEDTNREYSPLLKHKDAIQIDTTYSTPSEITKQLLNVIKK